MVRAFVSSALLGGLAVGAFAQMVPDLRMDTGSAPGAAASNFPELASTGSSVFVVWSDDRTGPYRGVYLNRSLDGGTTWLPLDVRVDHAPFGSSVSFFPQVAAAGSSAYVTWEDTRLGTSNVYFNRTQDGGATWLPNDIRLDTSTAPPSVAGSYESQVSAAGSSVYVTWEDTRNGAALKFRDIYFNRSLDGGATWLSSDVRLDTGTVPGASDSEAPRIVATGSSVFVAWTDRRNFLWDVYFNRSLDGGTTWLPTDIRLNTGVAPGSTISREPRIAAAGSSVFVTWEDSRNGNVDIYFNRSVDGGATWLPADVRIDTGSPAGWTSSTSPDVAAAGSSVFVVWEDDRNGNVDIYFNRSVDGGATWLPTDVRIDTGSPAGSTSSRSPRVAAAGSSVFVTWSESRTLLPDIYFNRSPDDGATWLSSDIRLDTGVAAGTTMALAPRIVAAGSSVYVTWSDGRNGWSDIYFNMPYGFRTYGTGKTGCGGFTPQLNGSGLSVFGQTVSLDASDGVGGSGGSLLLGLNKTSIPVPGGGTLLVLPMAMLPFGLGGTPGSCGAGTGSFPVAIPNNPLLVGLAFYFQGIFPDLGVPGGFSMTPGVELWVG